MIFFLFSLPVHHTRAKKQFLLNRLINDVHLGCTSLIFIHYTDLFLQSSLLLFVLFNRIREKVGYLLEKSKIVNVYHTLEIVQSIQ